MFPTFIFAKDAVFKGNFRLIPLFQRCFIEKFDKSDVLLRFVDDDCFY